MVRLIWLALLVVACGNKADAPRKLKKMDFKVSVDERGRMLPEIELFDDKHAPIAVLGTYTMTLLRPDGTVLCSVTRTLAKEDYADKRLKSEWQDAACPPDPAAEELRVNLEVKTGDKPEDTKLARDKTTPTKFIYKHLAAKPATPASGSGSSAGSGDAKLVAPVEATGSGSAGSNAGSGSGAAGSSDAKLVAPVEATGSAR